MSSFSRRDFMKIGAVSSLAIGATVDAFAEQSKQKPELEWTKAVCRYCGVGCGVMVGVSNGKVRSVEGDPENPVNRGMLCIKGYMLKDILYGRDRLTHPLIRKNGKLVKASWDEALDLIADKYKETLAVKGADGVAMYGSGQWTIFDGYVATKFMRAGIGSNHLEANARLCMASAVTAHLGQFGSDEPMGNYMDIDMADAYFLWGANMAECHPVLFSRMTARMQKDKNARLVEMATQRTRTTKMAHFYLEMKPQTDLALANAFAHVIIREKLYDKEFVRENVVFKKGLENPGYGLEDKFSFKDKPQGITFDEYVKRLEKYTPEYVSKISGVPPDEIIMAAKMFGDPKMKTMSLWTMGANQHSRGTWMNNLIINLHLLTGKISRPGMGPFSLTGQPSACGTVREIGTLAHRLPHGVVMNRKHREKAARIWNVPVEKIPPKPGYHTVEMFRALDRGELGVLWIQCTNPFHTLPNVGRYIKAAKEGKAFIVVSDVYPTRTTELADVVLPAAMWVEREGMFGNAERRTQHWFKAVEPPGEAKPDHIQIIEVAKRLGMGKLFEYEGNLEKSLFEEYRQFKTGTGGDLAPYENYHKTRGLLWPVVNGKETKWRYNAEYDPYVKKKKGIHFYGAKKNGEKAAVFFRPYEPPAESPDDEYPFWLCTGRILEHWHTASMTGRVKEIKDAAPTAVANFNYWDAQKLGINRGDRIKISSRRGAITLKADVNGRVVPGKGSVFVPFFDSEQLVNLLTLDSFCPISKEPDYKKCAVRVERA